MLMFVAGVWQHEHETKEGEEGQGGQEVND